MTVVTILKLDDRSPDFLQVPEDATMNGLLLQCPVEALGDAIRLWLGNEGEARRDAPEPDLVQEVIGRVLRTVDALLNVKLVCHFSECKAARFRGAVAGCPPPAGAVVVVGDRAGQPWTTRDPPTHVQITNACLLSGTGRFHATWT